MWWVDRLDWLWKLANRFWTFLDVFGSLKAAKCAEIGLIMDFGVSLQNDRIKKAATEVTKRRLEMHRQPDPRL